MAKIGDEKLKYGKNTRDNIGALHAFETVFRSLHSSHIRLITRGAGQREMNFIDLIPNFFFFQFVRLINMSWKLQIAN